MARQTSQPCSCTAGAFFFVGSNPHAPLALDPALPVEAEELEHGQRRIIAHHTPEFDIHEGALAVGAAMWLALGLHRLRPQLA
jgi:metal-dependent amidase/aminoacylase/carboxypeptidase family protein